MTGLDSNHRAAATLHNALKNVQEERKTLKKKKRKVPSQTERALF